MTERDEFSADSLSDAVDVLAGMPKWRLSAGWWVAVANAVTELEAAVNARDTDAFDDAVGALELLSPLRVWRAGSAPQPDREPKEDIDQELADRVVILAEKLDDLTER